MSLAASTSARRAWAVSAAATVVLLAGCGSGDAGSQQRYGSFTDCATVGRVSRSTDPAGDQRGRLAGAPAEPQGDLVGIALSRGRGRLCVEFSARAAIRPSAAYVIVLRPAEAERPVVQLEATVLATAAPEALLGDGTADAFRKVDATVGISGDRLSIVVTRAVFAAHGVARVFDAFRYQARAAVVTRDLGHLTDCAPSCR
jgi:hypothetical protein